MTQGTSSDEWKLRRLSGKTYLTFGRLSYALVTGAALLLVIQDAHLLNTIGAYTYLAAIAGAGSVVCALGIDRTLGRRIAAGEMQVGLPLSVLRFRASECLTIIAGAAVFATLTDSWAGTCSVVLFVIGRIAYSDIESMWISSRSGDAYLGFALLLNGLVSGGGIVVGAQIGAPLMVTLSALGNLVGLVLLLAKGKWKVTRSPLPAFIAEARGFALSAALSTVYSRSDLVIIALVGVPLPSVAIYGLVTRVFDAMTLIRGAVAQSETRDLAVLSIDARYARLAVFALRTQIIALVAATLGIGAVLVASLLDLVPAWTSQWSLLAFALAVVPLFFSHLPTTAMVYSDQRSHLLFIGSLISCVGSVLVKALLIGALSIEGAVMAIGIVEFLSCITFVGLYWRPRVSRVALTVVALPVAASLITIPAALLLFAS